MINSKHLGLFSLLCLFSLFSIANASCPTPAGLLSNTIGYACTTLTNGQTTGFTPQSVINFTFDAGRFSAYEGNWLQNVRFQTVDGSAVHALIIGIANNPTSNSLNTANTIIISFKMPNSAFLTANGGASPTNYIYADFDSAVNAIDLSVGGTGLAPQLSPFYDTYFSGNQVYTLSTDFLGNSCGANLFCAGVTVSNGLTVSGSGFAEFTTNVLPQNTILIVSNNEGASIGAHNNQFIGFPDNTANCTSGACWFIDGHNGQVDRGGGTNGGLNPSDNAWHNYLTTYWSSANAIFAYDYGSEETLASLTMYSQLTAGYWNSGGPSLMPQIYYMVVAPSGPNGVQPFSVQNPITTATTSSTSSVATTSTLSTSVSTTIAQIVLPSANVLGFGQFFLFSLSLIPFFYFGTMFLAFGIVYVRSRNIALALFFSSLIGYAWITLYATTTTSGVPSDLVSIVATITILMILVNMYQLRKKRGGATPAIMQNVINRA